jgi:hypothetical protein
MPEQYAHTLISDDLDFIPQPQQVAAFFDGLAKLGAAPSQPKLRVMKPSGEFRSGSNPLTGETIKIPGHTHISLGETSDIAEAIKGLAHYNVMMSGEGPPKLPALKFDYEGTYNFEVSCHLRAELVSTSSCHGEVPIDRKVPFFDTPCSSADRLGVFQHADTDKVIEVLNAGCSRFWIQFEYGKWLFPEMNDSLDLIQPSIAAKARECFGTTFVQGCHWCG